MLWCVSAVAQTVTTDGGEAAVADAPRYGYCSMSQLLQSQPEYVKAVQQLKLLREQYEKEALYNETDFRRQYSEYLNGQKDFPQAILLKRQRDLQESMEKGLAFRTQADSLLREAETEIFAPIRRKVSEAIQQVSAERGYDYVLDTDVPGLLYLNPARSEDITVFVEEKLR